MRRLSRTLYTQQASLDAPLPPDLLRDADAGGSITLGLQRDGGVTREREKAFQQIRGIRKRTG